MKECICGSVDTRRTKVYASVFGDARIASCARCGLARDITTYQYDTFYTDEAHIYTSPTEAQYKLEIKQMKLYVDFLRTYIPKTGMSLDIGANAGYLLEVLQKEGWSAQGLELNPSLTRYAQERGLNVINVPLENSLFADNMFDLVSMVSTLEHIPHAKNLLERVVKLLKPGGHLLISVPDYGCSLMKAIYQGRLSYFIPGQHIWYFTAETLERTCRMVSLKRVAVEKIIHLSPESKLPFGSLIKRLMIEYMKWKRQGNEILALFEK